MPSTKFVTSEDGSSRPRCSTRAASPMEDIPHQISHVFRYAEKKKTKRARTFSLTNNTFRTRHASNRSNALHPYAF